MNIKTIKNILGYSNKINQLYIDLILKVIFLWLLNKILEDNYLI